MEHQFKRGIGDNFVVAGHAVTAATIVRTAMVPNFALIIPMIVAMIAGTMIAGEASAGTLRGVLARPVSRSQVLTAKFLASAIYALSVTLFTGVTAALIGLIIFGHGDLMWIEWGPFVTMSEGEAWVRLAESYALAGGALLAVSAIAFLVSTLTNAPWIALAATMGVIIICPLVSAIPGWEGAAPYLLTSNLMIFRDVLQDPDTVNWGGIAIKGLHLAVYIIVPLAGAYLIFGKKDVLC
jgi:ABC-2 type transport system permease protein